MFHSTMSFSGPPYRCPTSLPRSVSNPGALRGATHTPGSTRPIDRESPRGRPRKPSGRDNVPIPSRQSINEAGIISLNSPEPSCPVDQGEDHDVPHFEISAEPDDQRDHRLAAHSVGPVADLYHHYLHETMASHPVKGSLFCTDHSSNLQTLGIEE